MESPADSDNKVKSAFTDPQNAGEKIEVEYEVSLAEDGKTLKFNMTDDGYKTAADFAKDMQAKIDAGKANDTPDEAKINEYKAQRDNLFRGNFHVGVHDGTNWTNQSVSATT